MAAVIKKAPPSHPTYAQMVTEAIVALKERSGSSQYAIAKHIEDHHKKDLPSNFKKMLLVQLKKLVANAKLTKVKNSFKLPPPAASDKPKKKPTEKKAPSAAAVVKKKALPPKPKATKVVSKPKPVKKTPLKAVAKKPKSIKSPVKKPKK